MKRTAYVQGPIEAYLSSKKTYPALRYAERKVAGHWRKVYKRMMVANAKGGPCPKVHAAYTYSRAKVEGLRRIQRLAIKP